MKQMGVIFSIYILLLLGFSGTKLWCGDYTYAISSFQYEFRPTNNTYNWQGTSTHKDRGWVTNYTVEVIYYKVPGTLNVNISKANQGGQSWTGKFKAQCNNDPILYGGVVCSPIQTIDGSFSALLDEILQNRNLCAIGIMLPSQTRESMRKEYEGINHGPYTLAPFPVSPKENSKQFPPIQFEMFLPFRFVEPCGGWAFEIFLERYDAKASNYKWKKVDTGKAIKGWEGKNFECRAKKEIKLSPGKYRYKLQAEHYQYGKTPWSLPFAFQVQFKPGHKVAFPTGISVTYPNGGEILHIRSDPYILTWKNVGTPRDILNDDVAIILLKNGEKFKLLKKKTPNKIGKARVILTRDIPNGADYKIKVRSLVNNKFSDDSDNNFTIMKITAKRAVKKR